MRRGPILAACTGWLVLAGCGAGPRVDLEVLRAGRFTLADGTQADGRELFGGGHTLVLTLDPECPLCLMHAPELAGIVPDTGLRIVGLYASPYIVADSVRAFALRHGFVFPQVLDPECTVATALHAVVTPEAFLLDAGGTVLYRGAIDDRAVRAGRKKPQAARHHLRDALEAVRRGQAPPQPQVRAVGCFQECTEVEVP